MKNKFILKNLSEDIETEYKTLRQIAKDLNIDYHNARAIYLESIKPKKFLHGMSKKLCEKYEIYDNPNLI